MSIFNAGIERNQTGVSKTEEYAKVYYAGGKTTVLDDGEYKHYKYTIETNGVCPTVKIIPKDDFISIHSGEYTVKLHDRNGEEKKLSRLFQTLIKNYNEKDDYTDKNPDGVRYTLQNLQDDCRAFIENLIVDEKEIFNEMD